MQGPILFVESDPKLRAHLAGVLEHKELRVTAVASAIEAFDAASQTSFPLLIAPVFGASGTGLELVARLREKNADQEVFLLGDSAEARAAAVRAGVPDCIVRPFDDAYFLLRVERCLERAALRAERRRLLDENREFVQSQSIQQRGLELLSNPDLEWLQDRVVAHLSSVCDAQSCALWVVDDRGDMLLKAYRGLLERHLLPEKLDRAHAQEMLRDGAPWLSGESPSEQLVVPLMAAGEPVGLLQLSDPLGGEFRPDHFKSARALSDFAAVGLRNGRRFLHLQRLGLRDRDTAAYNLSYFTDYASKEIYKARRYGRTFSVLTFSIDSLVPTRARLGADSARKATRGIIRALSQIIRDSDVIAKATEQEFYMLLPETDFFGATIFVRRAHAAIAEDPDVKEVDAKLPVSIVAGAATFPKDGEDFDELVLQCRRRMEERRASLQRRLHLEDLSFWEQVELLLGQPTSPKLPADARAEPSRRGKVSDALFEELQIEVARDLLRDPSARGVLYVGVPEVKADLPIAMGLETVPPDFAARVYVVGRRAGLESHPGVTPVFLEGDERLARHEFLLWMSENASYALLQRRGHGATWGFHTSDTGVVDGLVSRLQSEYDLQPY